MERRNFPFSGLDACCPERTMYKVDKHVIVGVFSKISLKTGKETRYGSRIHTAKGLSCSRKRDQNFTPKLKFNLIIF